MAVKDETMGRAPSGRTPVRPGEEPRKPRTPPAQFLREVRAEGRKVTWTGRKEVWITSVMVFIMVILAAIFLQLVDLGLGFVMRWLLNTFAA